MGRGGLQRSRRQGEEQGAEGTSVEEWSRSFRGDPKVHIAGGV